MEWFSKARKFREIARDRLSIPSVRELEKEDFPLISLSSSRAEVKLLELPGIYRVTHDYQSYSGFRYFMDGAQRTFLWRYYSFNGLKVPVYLHFSGAVILERISPAKFIPRYQSFRSSLILPSFLYEEYKDEVEAVDSGASKPWDMGEMKARAEVKSRALRQELEVSLMNNFFEECDELLVKDGNIAEAKSSRVVGIVKTHATLYLQERYPELQLRVWNMQKYHRSPVFSLKLLDGSRVNSFYLRLHDPLEPERGLIRVEFSKQDVQKISEWLIAESLIAAKCSRWDRQIYPIQKCEEYIKNQLPSPKLFKAAAGGLV